MKNDYGKLETDDELEARKAWHESRFLKNVQMNKSSTPKDSYFQKRKFIDRPFEDLILTKNFWEYLENNNNFINF